MQIPPDGKGFESMDDKWLDPIWDGRLISLRSMRILRVSPIRTETGGIKRLNRKVDWDTLVDALYAPKNKFPPN